MTPAFAGRILTPGPAGKSFYLQYDALFPTPNLKKRKSLQWKFSLSAIIFLILDEAVREGDMTATLQP